ncbi:hypothetical protein [uncultured Cohaesibacter sp.]|uniref:hypothetical protein n=1 Tax=uncultured Cohaesibacter sp. TaxID=1002546 RepID=UPI0029C8CE71|nr:hypothetical protein [uncultured Cohaesibacter sp.]
MRGWIVFGVVALFVGSANAADFPRYDPEGYCKAYATDDGLYSSESYNYCIGDEQQAYDAVKESWGEYPDQVTDYCLDYVGYDADASYESLQYCLKDEMQALAGKKAFKF